MKLHNAGVTLLNAWEHLHSFVTEVGVQSLEMEREWKVF